MKETIRVVKDRVTVTDVQGRTITHPIGSIRIYDSDGRIKKVLPIAQAIARQKKLKKGST